jgi:hypothetical protein
MSQVLLLHQAAEIVSGEGATILCRHTQSVNVAGYFIGDFLSIFYTYGLIQSQCEEIVVDLTYDIKYSNRI